MQAPDRAEKTERFILNVPNESLFLERLQDAHIISIHTQFVSLADILKYQFNFLIAGYYSISARFVLV